MIPILFHPAAGTGIQPVRQRHFLPVSAGCDRHFMVVLTRTRAGRMKKCGDLFPPPFSTGRLPSRRSLALWGGARFSNWSSGPGDGVPDGAGSPRHQSPESDHDTFVMSSEKVAPVDLFGSISPSRADGSPPPVPRRGRRPRRPGIRSSPRCGGLRTRTGNLTGRTIESSGKTVMTRNLIQKRLLT